jgi:hypothetical protein
VGIDSSGSYDIDDIQAMIRGHIERLREYPEYAEAYIEVFVESNLSYLSANAVANMVMSYPRVNVAREDKLGRYGVHTGEAEKENYAKGLGIIMMDNMLHFAHHVASVDWKENRMGLIDQLRVFRREVIESKSPGFSNPKVCYTGKSHGRKDDLVLALQIALYWMAKKRGDLDFIAKYNAKGVRVGGLALVSGQT